MSDHRVLVVDDSTTSRTLLTAILDADPDLTVVGEAADGAAAVEAVQRLRPSIVVMDINMPKMDGFEATKRIMIEQPTPILIVTASYDAGQVEIGLRAVGAGALTVAPKPAGPHMPGFHADAARLVTLVKALADVKVVRQRERGDARLGKVPAAPVGRPSPSITAVGVAASTGGPAALYQFLAVLPRTLNVPVLVVQHIAEGFVDGLARWLATASVLPVCVATDDQAIRGGEVYIAPDGHHLTLQRGRLKLSTADPVGGFRPSASVMLASLAEWHGAGAAAVVLTGMGTDGLAGASRVRAAGGLVLAQDADSSVVFGMPSAVANAGVAHVIGPVEELAHRVARSAPQR